MTTSVGLVAAFVGGVVSFLSPCVLPSVAAATVLVLPAQEVDDG